MASSSSLLLNASFYTFIIVYSQLRLPNLLIRHNTSMMIPSILFIAAIGGFSALAFNDTCYGPPFQGGGPEGHVYSGDSPCSQSTDDNVARACCGYSDGSICLSNGLCFVPQNNSILQGSCTDPNWTSPGCPETKCVGMRPTLCIYR